MAHLGFLAQCTEYLPIFIMYILILSDSFLHVICLFSFLPCRTHGQIASVLFFSTVIFNSESMLLLVDLVCRSLLLDDCNPSVMLTHSVMARYCVGEVELGLVKWSDGIAVDQLAERVQSEMGRGGVKSSGWPNVTWLFSSLGRSGERSHDSVQLIKEASSLALRASL